MGPEVKDRLFIVVRYSFFFVQSGTHSGMEDDPGIASPSTLSSRGGGGQMSPSTSETSESRCMYASYLHCTTRIY